MSGAQKCPLNVEMLSWVHFGTSENTDFSRFHDTKSTDDHTLTPRPVVKR